MALRVHTQSRLDEVLQGLQSREGKLRFEGRAVDVKRTCRENRSKDAVEDPAPPNLETFRAFCRSSFDLFDRLEVFLEPDLCLTRAEQREVLEFLLSDLRAHDGGLWLWGCSRRLHLGRTLRDFGLDKRQGAAEEPTTPTGFASLCLEHFDVHRSVNLWWDCP